MLEIAASHSSTGCHGWPLKLRRTSPAALGRTLNSSRFGGAAEAAGRWIVGIVSFPFASSGLPEGWPGDPVLTGPSPAFSRAARMAAMTSGDMAPPSAALTSSTRVSVVAAGVAALSTAGATE
jgi:hypothetical protein